jgi:tetratricopeptide (TPR) repeat protein
MMKPKQRCAVLLLAVLASAFCLPQQLFAQGTTTVKGTCKDLDGKPYAGAVVEFTGIETGRKYSLKTNNKGEYFSLGVATGTYDIVLKVDGKDIFRLNRVPAGSDENIIDIDLKKEQASGARQMSEEDKKKLAEQEAKQNKDRVDVKSLNDKLAGARAAILAGNFDQAVTTMTEATQIDPARDLIWFTMGEALRGQAKSKVKTDPPASKEAYGKAAEAYQKAIAIKPQGAYYNNLADAYAHSGDVDGAVKAYNEAATLDPPGMAGYQFNIGAVYTNAGRVDEAVKAFQASVAADPTKAESFYQLGVSLVGKATTDKNGKVVPVPGTEEALTKYLELAPTGPNVEGAKGLLTYIGSTVETTFGKQKKGSKK